MFNPFKTYRKLKNSKTWGEFIASYFIDLDKIYKELEGKTEAQQIEILKQALEDQTKKTGELVEENQRLKERLKELESKADYDNLLKILTRTNEKAERVGKELQQAQMLFSKKR
jgi:glycine cleavage system H lipoate-binding protein